MVGLPVAWPVRAEKLKQEALEQLAQTHNKLKQTNRKTNNWKNKKGKHIIEYTKKHHILSKQTRKQIARITGKLQSYDNKLTGKQRRGLYYNHLKRGNAMKW